MAKKSVKNIRYAPKRHKRYKLNAGKFAVFFIAIAAVAVVALLLVLNRNGGSAGNDEFTDTGTFYEGVFVDSVALAGLTYEEGLERVRQAAQAALDEIEITLTYQGSSWRFGAEDINAVSDAEQLVNEAYRAGREGNTSREMKEEQDRLLVSPLVLRSSISYNLAAMRPYLDEIKEEIDIPAVNAEVSFTPNEENMFVYSPESAGFELNADNVFNQITNLLNDGYKVSLELSPEPVEPEIREEDLRSASKQIAEFSTSLGNSTENRRFNVAKSLAAFNGVIIKPGEQLSFNETTGERTPENGYRDAPVIGENKQMVDGPGGGVCQTSTTLYNAALLADLKIVKRYHHSFPSSYVDKGFDATVNWPNLDLIIENNRSLPIFIHTYVYENRVYVVFFGSPRTDGLSIQLLSDVYRTEEAPEPKIASDTNAKYVRYEDQTYDEPSRGGYMVRAYKVYYKDGVEVDKVLVNDDYYQPIVGTTYVGVSKRPDATPEPTPEVTNTQEPTGPTETPLPPIAPPDDEDPGQTEDPEEPVDG